MKKILALFFATCALLSAQAATQYLNRQYRVGTGALKDNTDGRIHASQITSDRAYVTDSGSTQTNYLYATIPDGQQFEKWWFYYYTGQTATSTNTWLNTSETTQTNCTWSYKKFSDIYSSDKAIRIVADFDYIKYTLAYNNNGGSGNMSSEQHVYTNKYNLAANTFTKTGYTFGGWTNSVITSALADQAMVTGKTFKVTYTNKNATIYAKWNPNSYTVRFNKNADDATGSMSDQPFTYDVAQNLSANGFSREGYVLGGWTNATITAALADGASVKNLASEDGAEVELFAKWTHLWTIIFEDASQFGSSGFSTNIYEHGETISVPSNPSHDGYTFTGWTPSVSPTATGNATYTASYSANSYKVVFHSNYGEDVVNDSMTFKFGSAFNIPGIIQGITSRTGYTLLGWATQPESTEADYTPAQQGVLFSNPTQQDLYAVWAPITYTISFDKNGGDGTMSDIENVSYDVAVALPACAFEKSGVEFKCWRYGGNTYEDGATVSNLTTTAGATVTLTAVWSEKCYVEYNANGGNGEMDSQTFDGEELPQALSSNAFTRTGYTFGGWAANQAEAVALVSSYADGQVFETFASLPADAGETATLFAVWQTNAYTVVFNPNCRKYTGEMADMNLFYDHETNLTANAFVNEAGLHFAGWSNTVTGVTYVEPYLVSNLTAEANGVVTLNAIWDNGELSKAMHCENLYWENQPSAAEQGFTWLPKYGTGIGYDDDSCVTTNGTLYSYMIANIATNGVLRFKWKANLEATQSDARGLKFGYYIGKDDAATSFTDLGTLVRSATEAANEAWLDAEIEIKDDYFVKDKNRLSEIWIVLRSRAQSCFIDQLTWTPEGYSIEPTEEDRPVINEFASVTTGEGSGFQIRISNASSDFDYQVLATNELTTAVEWPVITNLTSDVIGTGYTIEIDDGEPKMFYKVKVIGK